MAMGQQADLTIGAGRKALKYERRFYQYFDMVHWETPAFWKVSAQIKYSCYVKFVYCLLKGTFSKQGYYHGITDQALPRSNTNKGLFPGHDIRTSGWLKLGELLDQIAQ